VEGLQPHHICYELGLGVRDKRAAKIKNNIFQSSKLRIVSKMILVKILFTNVTLIFDQSL